MAVGYLICLLVGSIYLLGGSTSSNAVDGGHGKLTSATPHPSSSVVEYASLPFLFRFSLANDGLYLPGLMAGSEDPVSINRLRSMASPTVKLPYQKPYGCIRTLLFQRVMSIKERTASSDSGLMTALLVVFRAITLAACFGMLDAS